MQAAWLQAMLLAHVLLSASEVVPELMCLYQKLFETCVAGMLHLANCCKDWLDSGAPELQVHTAGRPWYVSHATPVQLCGLQICDAVGI